MNDDLISRHAVIEALGERPLVWEEYTDEYELGQQKQYDLDRAAIETIPSAFLWIPVSKRLPDYEEKNYWVCDDEGYQYRCRWTNDRFGLGRNTNSWGWYIMDIPQFSHIVAWMPLPKPYKEEKVENLHKEENL